MEEHKQPQVSKTWCFTLNNYTEADIKFFDDLEVSYLCYGKENDPPAADAAPLVAHVGVPADAGAEHQGKTPHLQGYVIFKRAYRFPQLKKLHAQCHWEASKVKDAMNYCMKDQNYTIRDNRTPGKRNDFAEKAEIIKTHKTKRSMLLDPRLYSTMARYGSWAASMAAACPPTQVDIAPIVFRPWQKVLMDLVQAAPRPRKIHWWFDQVGGQGKSFMTNLLCRNHGAFLASGKKADVLYAYKDSLAEIVIFDLTRSQEGEYCPYSTMETLKNGFYLSTKYQSAPVWRDTGCHLIVFANFQPDKNKMSMDRWDIHILGSIF